MNKGRPFLVSSLTWPSSKIVASLADETSLSWMLFAMTVGLLLVVEHDRYSCFDSSQHEAAGECSALLISLSFMVDNSIGLLVCDVLLEAFCGCCWDGCWCSSIIKAQQVPRIISEVLLPRRMYRRLLSTDWRPSSEKDEALQDETVVIMGSSQESVHDALDSTATSCCWSSFSFCLKTTRYAVGTFLLEEWPQ